MRVYLDTNLIVHSLLSEEDNGGSWTKTLGHPAPIIWLTQLEVTNAIQQSVVSGFGPTQRRITPEMASIAQLEFSDALKAGLTLKPVTIPEAKLTKQFESLSLRYTARHGFRTYDLMHVSAALCLKCDTFWSFDARASKLAKLAGLKVLKQRR
jgi:predicted nucleic acid-binding protein